MLGWHRSCSRTRLAMLSALCFCVTASTNRIQMTPKTSQMAPISESHVKNSSTPIAHAPYQTMLMLIFLAQSITPQHTEIETQACESSDCRERSNLEGDQGDKRGGVSYDAAWAWGNVQHGHMSPAAPCWGLARAYGGVCTLSHSPFWLYVQAHACVNWGHMIVGLVMVWCGGATYDMGMWASQHLVGGQRELMVVFVLRVVPHFDCGCECACIEQRSHDLQSRTVTFATFAINDNR